MALWSASQQAMQRITAMAYAVRLQYENVKTIASFYRDRGINFPEPEIANTEQRMATAIKAIDELRRMHCDVTGQRIGVALSPSGNDLDLVEPGSTIGAIWIPIAIGVVVVAGIIARWAYLEKEINTISDHYNGILIRADQSLCADPNSQMCKDWKSTKAKGGYTKRETIVDSVKSAVGKVGGYASTGLGVGLAIAIPAALLLLASRTSRKD